jgi:hypothetical protein
VALKLKLPTVAGVTELEAGTEFAAPTVTVPSGVAVPVQVLPVKKK